MLSILCDLAHILLGVLTGLLTGYAIKRRRIKVLALCLTIHSLFLGYEAWESLLIEKTWTTFMKDYVLEFLTFKLVFIAIGLLLF